MWSEKNLLMKLCVRVYLYLCQFNDNLNKTNYDKLRFDVFI